MTGVLYLCELIAFAWLVMWTLRDPERPTELWWPFDMKGDETPVGTQPGLGASGNWRRRGAGGAPWRSARTPPPAEPGPEERGAPPGDTPPRPDQAGRATTRNRTVTPGSYRPDRSPSRPPSGPGMAR